MLRNGGLITAAFMIVFGLIITMGWLDWLVRLGGIVMIAWGIVLAVVAASGGKRGRRW
jgi:hypothetical protein